MEDFSYALLPATWAVEFIPISKWQLMIYIDTLNYGISSNSLASEISPGLVPWGTIREDRSKLQVKGTVIQ